MLLFLVGGLLLFGISVLCAIGVGQCIAFGNDDDAPAHVGNRDWTRVTERHVPHAIPFRRQ